MDTATVALNSLQIYLNANFSDIILSYTQVIQGTAIYLANYTGQDINDETLLRQIIQDSKDIVAFETKIAAALYKLENTTFTASNVYHRVSVDTLKTNWSSYDWDDFFKQMLPLNYADLVTGSYQVVVTVPSFFDDLNAILRDTSMRTKINYLFWREVYNKYELFEPPIGKLRVMFEQFRESLPKSACLHRRKWLSCRIFEA